MVSFLPDLIPIADVPGISLPMQQQSFSMTQSPNGKLVITSLSIILLLPSFKTSIPPSQYDNTTAATPTLLSRR